MFPATQLKLDVEGNMENARLSLEGDSTIHATASVGLGVPVVIGLWASLAKRSERPH